MSNSNTNVKNAGVLALVVILALGALIGVNYFQGFKKSDSGLTGTKTLAVTGEVTATTADKSTIYCVGDLMVESLPESIKAKKIDGSGAWSQKVSAERILPAGDNILIVSKSKKVTCITKNNKLVWSHMPPYPITDIIVENNGAVLLEYDRGAETIIEAFDPKGTRLGNATLQNAHVLSYTAGKNKDFSISVLDVSSENLMGKVITYNYKGEIVWAHNFENEIIPAVKYSEDGSLIAVGEKRLYRCKSDSKEVAKTEVGGKILSFALNEKMAVVVLNQRGRHVAVSYDNGLKAQGKLEVKNINQKLYAYKTNYILYSREQMTVANIKGKVVTTYKPTGDINQVYMTEGDKVYIVSNRKLQQLVFQ